MTDQAFLQQLKDEHEIQQLMIHYTCCIDGFDPAAAAACFAKHGVGIYWGEFVGHAAIEARLVEILSRYHSCSHHLSNIQITFNGDKANAMSAVYAFHRYADTLECMHYWGRWIDELVREEGIWKFARREVLGIGSINADSLDGDLSHPGFPGRKELPAAK